MSTVELKSFKKSYGAVDVLHSVDLAIDEGEFVALVGPSGCGKSTMLRMIAGLEEISGGELLIDGKLANKETPRARNIAMVFQNYALYPHMTVRENIGLNLKISGLTKAQADLRVNEVSKLLHLDDLLDRRPWQLSGGQRQRVAMGRAIVRAPAVFLFDEPLSNLDAKLRVQMRAEIKSLHASVKTTSIYVTHDQIEAMTLADRIVVMNKGHIEQVGSPIDLYQNPKNVFVAGFIGSPSMNFIRAVVSREDHRVFANLGKTSRVELSARYDVAHGQDIILGIRPEHLGFDAAHAQFTGIVGFVEPTGAQTQVTVMVDETAVVAVINGHAAVSTGQPVTFGYAAEHLYVFDGKTETRISEKPLAS